MRLRTRPPLLTHLLTGSCSRAAARMRSAGCPCAPAQDSRPVEVTVGPGGRWFWGCAAYGPSGAPPRVPRPSRGGEGSSLARRGGAQGRHPLRAPPAFRRQGEGEGGEGGGLAGAPCCPPRVHRCLSPAAAGAVARRSWPGPCLRPVVGRRTPLPASRSAGAGWRPSAPGAARGLSCWRVSPGCHARPCAVWLARGGGGERMGGLGSNSGGRCSAGGRPGPLIGTPLPPSFQPLGARLFIGPSPSILPPPASPPSRRVAPFWGGGGLALAAAVRVSG